MKIGSVITAGRISAVLASTLVLASLWVAIATPMFRSRSTSRAARSMPPQGKYKEATIQFSNALRVDHNFAAAHYELAKAYVKSGSMMPAYTELMRTIDLQPGNVEARIDLGDMLVAGRQLDRAAQQAAAVLAVQPNNADAHALLSAIAANKGDRATALEEINKALAVNPNKATYHSALGLIQSSDPTTAAAAEGELHKARRARQ